MEFTKEDYISNSKYWLSRIELEGFDVIASKIQANVDMYRGELGKRIYTSGKVFRAVEDKDIEKLFN